LVSVFRDRGALLAFPFLVVYSLVTLTESIAVVYNDFRWALFVAFAAKLAFSDREQAKV
jgi:exopolysaccharide production protein ExoQ